ncbi:hypothetical protein KW786_03160, partial [Candidatus Parcubacteria bacterium]|nr:hypothetical protein [Candidatus Parcubacteria bacterium]
EKVAYSLATMLLRGYSADEIDRFQFFLNERLSGSITKEALIEALDKPYKEGGIGLWKQRVKKISDYVESVIEERKEITHIYQELSKQLDVPLQAEAFHLRQWLLAEYHGKIDQLQQIRLDELLMERLRKIISEENFKEALMLPKSKFGLGLSLHASQRISEKLELALDFPNG